jgi:hypothetical protein
MKNIYLFFLVIGVVALGGNAFATKYYVNGSTGNNANSATDAQNSATPWQTINFAILNANVVAGDTIDIAAGTYAENVDVKKGVCLLGTGGTGSKPVITGGAAGLWVVKVHARNVSIQNITLEVNQTTNIYGILADTAGKFDGLQVLNSNIFSVATGSVGCASFQTFGLFLGKQFVTVTDRVTVKGTKILPKNPALNCIFGRGIRTFGTSLTVGGVGADSCNITGTYAIQTGNPNGGPLVIENNTLNGVGIEINNPLYVPIGFSDQHRILNNRFGTDLTAGTLTQIEIKENYIAVVVIRIEGNTFSGLNLLIVENNEFINKCLKKKNFSLSSGFF